MTTIKMTAQHSIAAQRDNLHRVLAACVHSDELLLVAYSGGVDSAYLAWEAHTVLGEGMLAVLADSPSLPRKELTAAIEFAELHSIPLRVLQTSELQSEKYSRNDSSRCFHCKEELFRVMEDFSRQPEVKKLGLAKIAYGRNLDDDGDFRPGQRAAENHSVLSPLAMAGLGKQDVRNLARQMGLSLWNKPASACLASRVEHGRTVTVETLRQIELAEEHLHQLGFCQVRVRHHGEVARVEIDRSELALTFSLDMLDRISTCIRACGFKYVALDTDGYRSGSMNEAIAGNQAIASGTNTLVPVEALTLNL
jgi:pyridinium-3,5-biscarboxylic acid mononucleotide sulfurtransferase